MGEIDQRAADERAADARGAGPLALLEAIDRDGQVRQAWRVERWPLSIGRALDNDVVLTDPHVAAHHATLAPESGGLLLRAGDTMNGIGFASGGHVGRGFSGERLAGGQSRVVVDDGRDLELQLGRTALRLRLAGHALAAEQVLAPAVALPRRGWPTALLALAVVAFILVNTWIDNDPEALARSAGTNLLSAVFGGGLWCGLWALLSKTFTRQSQLGWHLRVFVVASLSTLALSVLPPLAAFAFSAPWITDFSFVAIYAVVAAAIYFHLLAVEPARPRLMRAMAAAGLVAGIALSLWFNVQRTGRPGEELYMNHLFTPQLRAARLVPVDRFVARLAPMQAILDKKAKEQSGAEGEPAHGSDDEE